MGRLVKDGNKVYEIDEECMRQKEKRRRNDVRDGVSSNRKDRDPKGRQQQPLGKCIRKYPF